MFRALLILGLFVASVANAAPTEWTLPPLPADWKDVTTEMMSAPAMAAYKETVIKQGGTFAATIYESGNGDHIMVITSVFADNSAKMATVDAFMDGARTRAIQNATEISWNLDRMPTALVSTQRVDNRGLRMTTKTYVGYLENDLRATIFMCVATDEVCAPLIAKVAVDTTGMRLLSELDAKKKKLTPRRIAAIIVGVLLGIFILGVLWKRRPRTPT